MFKRLKPSGHDFSNGPEEATASRLITIDRKFGTFQGVFTPSALTIFGVIMYLRLGWMVGNVGLAATLLIVVLASAITFLTALSIAATATNMKVAGGGAYYMISRSLGLEAGGAVGIPLYFAQALGISFYLSGFAEAVLNIYDVWPAPTVALVALGLLFGLAFKSADIALKSQLLILGLIIISLFSFFLGDSPDPATLESLRVDGLDVGFWTAFAVFFPAVTGIEAGISMSGDLKKPGKSLPLGTIAAVLCGLVIYIAIPIFLAATVADSEALKSSKIMQKIATHESLILVGVWGATLSSAMGALLGAPRTLQALARDGVLSKYLRFLGRGFGADDAPRIATVATLVVASAGILLGDLNAIAPVLAMFFLTSYGVLNFSAGIEGMIGNPAWRPRFRTPWWLSLAGSGGCFIAMFMIDPGSTFIALLVSATVYYLMKRKNIQREFGDLRHGMLLFLAHYSIFKLSELPPNLKSWRPNILVFSGAPQGRWYLIELAHAISHGKGFLTVATLLPKGSTAENRILQTQKSIVDYLRKRQIHALVSVSAADNINDGIVSLTRSYGMGSLVPNTILLGETENEENFENFIEMIFRIHQAKRNIVIVREGANDRSTTSRIPTGLRNIGTSPNTRRRIDVWWGRQQANAGFALTLGYMLQNSAGWSGAQLHLKSVVTKTEERQPGGDYLKRYIKEGRVDAVADVYLADAPNQVFQTIRQKSAASDLVFIGMKMPDMQAYSEDPSGYVASYARYYRQLLRDTAELPNTLITLTAEDLNFKDIFT